MPRTPTKDTTSVNVELPTALVERLRTFAKRDMRSIKSEVVRALNLLLDTFDTFTVSPAGNAQTIGAASMQTLAGVVAQSRPVSALIGPSSAVGQMNASTYAAFLKRLSDRKSPLYDLALRAREGMTAHAIAESVKMPLPDVYLQLGNLDKAAQRFIALSKVSRK